MTISPGDVDGRYIDEQTYELVASTERCVALAQAIQEMHELPYGDPSWHYGPWSVQLNKSNTDHSCTNEQWQSWIDAGCEEGGTFLLSNPATRRFQIRWNTCDEVTRDCALELAARNDTEEKPQ